MVLKLQNSALFKAKNSISIVTSSADGCAAAKKNSTATTHQRFVYIFGVLRDLGFWTFSFYDNDFMVFVLVNLYTFDARK